jgi:hypothetical protein
MFAKTLLGPLFDQALDLFKLPRRNYCKIYCFWQVSRRRIVQDNDILCQEKKRRGLLIESLSPPMAREGLMREAISFYLSSIVSRKDLAAPPSSYVDGSRG